MFETNNIEYFRKGVVIEEALDNIYCCHIAEITKILFEYIEVKYLDGSRIFIYDNQKAFDLVERNFIKNRFTSFCELFTTEEFDVDDRGFAQFKYFVRRSKNDYYVMPLDKALVILQNEKCLKNRIIKYNQYDENIDYHF